MLGIGGNKIKYSINRIGSGFFHNILIDGLETQPADIFTPNMLPAISSSIGGISMGCGQKRRSIVAAVNSVRA